MDQPINPDGVGMKGGSGTTAGTGVALDALLARIHGNVAAMHQLVGLMLGHLPGRLEAVNAAVEAGDADALSAAAHSLRGSLSNFTVGESWTLAGDLEAAAREGDLVAGAALAAALHDAVMRVDAELRTWLTQNAPETTP